MWIIYACLAAIFAGITSILAKCGIKKTNSDVATAIRTIIVLVFSWLMVFIVGSQNTITNISGKSFTFLVLSGLATGGSWLCYFKALQAGDVNKVVPIDKSSTVLSVFFAIIILGETDNLAIRLLGIILIAIGTFLMIERRDVDGKDVRKSWLMYAVLSAVFAALTSILGKIGIEGVESNLGTAIRTVVVLIMAWGIVFLKGKQNMVKEARGRELLFICLSGVATGASWLFYYKALHDGIVSIVVPIDKLSILVAVAFSRIVFKERLSKRSGLGLSIIVAGTLAMAIFS